MREEAKKRSWILLAAMLLAGVGGFGYWLTIPSQSETTEVPPGPPPILRFEEDGYRYTYHVPSGVESLYELASDPDCLRNLAREQPERARHMQETLAKHAGVEKLQDLQRDFEEHIAKLKALGYL